MNTKICLPIIALAIAATGCDGNKQTAQQGGIQVANLDTMVNPRDDFYQYACGGWMKAHPLTSEYSS